ncbi:hypothetical protein [Polaribacter sp. Asnod6-C07]|uniref:hypothetical protein n=1 Tax=Polaribacter sp. Asnod6-C07 TaxID=3160582 RepID=UPI00386E168A
MAYIGYYQLNIDYIIETYCVNKNKPELQCNGKCHLAKQISNDIDTSDDDVKGINIITDAFFPVFLQKNDEYLAKHFTFYQKKTIRNKNSLHSYSFLNKLEQPPDFLS